MAAFDTELRRDETDAFLLLRENRFAYTAVLQLGQSQQRSISPYAFLYGPPGIGKSHLVRQFLRERERRPGERMLQQTAAEFAEDFAKAKSARSVPEFRAAYENVELLVVEDLQALQRHRDAQESFEAILDDVADGQGRILLTANAAPADLDGLSARLVNRLRSGVCAELEPLGRSSRVSLLAHFASTRQILLPMDVIRLLAEHFPVAPRELLGALLQLESAAGSLGQKIDRAFTTRYLEGEVRPQQISVRRVASTVAEHFDVTVADLRSPSRSQQHVLPRQIAMHLARELTSEPLNRIAAHFQRKNHSTVLHACSRIEDLLRDDPAFEQQVVRIRRKLGVPG